MIERVLTQQIEANLTKQKVGLLLGARRVGKTALLQVIRQKTLLKVLWLNGEDTSTESLLEERTVSNYQRLLSGFNVLIIDEAQHIKDIALKAKLMIDEIRPLHIILTGSSAFNLHQSGESLTGRTITYHLHPLAQIEFRKEENLLETKQHLEDRLVYGSYPETVNLAASAEKEAYMKELINIFLLKDILAFENVRNPQKLKDLLALLAHQIGSEVSLHELGRQLAISKNTVEKYLDLLEKVYLIYRRKGFSRNARKEIAKSNRWYFYDNGIRNAVIGNFNFLSLRQDTGMLWENYFISERLKRNDYKGDNTDSYFWRTYDQQEIDLIEEQNGKLTAFECKWKEQKVKIPGAFAKAYPEASFHIIHKENYLGWVEE